MGINIAITEDNTKEFKDEFEEAIERFLWEVGAAAETYAKIKCPVDTGNLRNSITHQEHNEEMYTRIGSNVDYAKPVETGTPKMPARPYLKPAITDHKDTYRAILADEFSKIKIKK